MKRTDKKAQPYSISERDIKPFLGHCMEAYALQINLSAMYTHQELLKKTAPIFFGDTYSIFREHIVLQVCKMADPAEDKWGNKNLTFDFFIKWSPVEVQEKLKPLRKTMVTFIEKIRPARNKIIAHIDHETVLRGEFLGAAEQKEWDKFWENLEGFLKILSNGDFILRDVAYLSDVTSLTKALEVAQS